MLLKLFVAADAETTYAVYSVNVRRRLGRQSVTRTPRVVSSQIAESRSVRQTRDVYRNYSSYTSRPMAITACDFDVSLHTGYIYTVSQKGPTLSSLVTFSGINPNLLFSGWGHFIWRQIDID